MYRKIALTVLVAALAFYGSISIGGENNSEFIGAKNCGLCHPTAFAQWKTTAHARAYESLEEAFRGDQTCVACHSSGVRADLQGVQCESCHGAGRHYGKSYIMVDDMLANAVGLQEMSENVCKRCHTDEAPTLTGFNYPEAWKRIQHGPEPKPEPERPRRRGRNRRQR